MDTLTHCSRARLRLVVLFGIFAWVCGAVAQQVQPLQQPKPKPPVNNTAPTTKDQVDRARQSLEDLQSPVSRSRQFTFDRIARKEVQVNSTITFQAQLRNPSVISNQTFTYSLRGAPDDASINSQTGVFSWVPTTPGLYSFFVVATDDEDLPRTAVTPVTIRVTQPLELFGYSFFKSARALIDSRLSFVRAGLNAPQNPNSNTQAAAALPIVTQGKTMGAPSESALDQTRSKTGSAVGGQLADTVVTGRSPSATDRKGDGDLQSQGSRITGLGTETLSAQAVSSLSDATRRPSPLQDQPNADALRYFVGPFDMLGLNVFVPAPERYQLGAGDVLTLRYWSPALDAVDVDLKVDQQGVVSLPTGRKLVVRGKTLQQTEADLRRNMLSDIKNVQVTLSLKALRTMSITVLGDAYLPGSYQVPAVATLFNALYMFGGPSETGSLRNVQLRRTDGSRRTFDMYKFLVSGDSKQDVPLQPGDTIWIPPAGARVTVEGEVARPGIYEAAPGEHLRSLIGFAGGPRSTGVVQRVSLQTVNPSVGRELRDVDISGKGTTQGDPVVLDGDIATVESVRELFTNAITLEGAVDQPGEYAAVPGTTVADLIRTARGLLPEAYATRADLFRRNPEGTQTLIHVNLQQALARVPAANVSLQPYDRLVVYGVQDVQWVGDRQITVRGSVQRPGVYSRANNMTIGDVLLQAGGLTPDAYTRELFLQRTEANGVLGPLVKIDFKQIQANDPAANLLLQDGDVLQIQSLAEAHYMPDSDVRILGSVQNPGSFPRGSNMHLSDLLKLAGGPLPDAETTVEITNARKPYESPRTHFTVNGALSGTEDPALADGDLVTIAARTDILLKPKKVMLLGAVAHPGPYSVNSKTDRLSGLIERAGGFGPNAYPNGAQFFRDPKLLTSLSQNRLSPKIMKALDIVNQDSYTRALAKAELDKARLIKSTGSSSALTLPGLAAPVGDTPVTLPTNLLDQSTVSPARPLTVDDLEPGGNLDVDLLAALRKKTDKDDLVLEDGDVIVVPTTPTSVSVVGAVTVSSAVLFVPAKNIDYYINRSGGLAADAAKDHILVIRARGTVIKADGRTKLELGDIIWVPTKVMAERLSDRTQEIDNISKTVISGAIMLAVIRSIFGG